jgi:hypothetical protein
MMGARFYLVHFSALGGLAKRTGLPDPSPYWREAR